MQTKINQLNTQMDAHEDAYTKRNQNRSKYVGWMAAGAIGSGLLGGVNALYGKPHLTQMQTQCTPAPTLSQPAKLGEIQSITPCQYQLKVAQERHYGLKTLSYGLFGAAVALGGAILRQPNLNRQTKNQLNLLDQQLGELQYKKSSIGADINTGLSQTPEPDVFKLVVGDEAYYEQLRQKGETVRLNQFKR